MTYTDALKRFKQALMHEKIKYSEYVATYGETVYETEEFIKILEIGVEALEKQIPKKPDDTYEDSLDDECAVCGTYIFERDRYCPRCGQAIDWSE